MTKKILGFIVFILIASNSKASLINDGSILLTIDPGIVTCPLGGAYPECNLDISTATGSYFRIDSQGHRAISQGQGIILGTAQAYDGDSVNTQTPYDGSGQNITSPWLWGKEINEGVVSYPMGTNWTSTAITADNAGGLDMSGWRVTWNTVADSDFGAGGTGVFQCMDINGVKSVDACVAGDSYILDYSVETPNGLPSFGLYQLHLEGTITTLPQVPVPAAVWLFVSGLIGLIGVTRRKKA